jgi:hypothetical protein
MPSSGAGRRPDETGIGHKLSVVMPALVAGIHVSRRFNDEGVDGRDKPGHDEGRTQLIPTALRRVMPARVARAPE